MQLARFGKTGEKNLDCKHSWTQISHTVPGMLYVLWMSTFNVPKCTFQHCIRMIDGSDVPYCILGEAMSNKPMALHSSQND